MHQISQFGTYLVCRSRQSRASSAKVVVVDHARDGLVHAAPDFGKRVGSLLPAVIAALDFDAFDEAQHFADGDRVRRARQQISAFGAAARFDEAALLQAGQDQFQKLLGDLLPSRDVGDFHWLAGRLQREVEDGVQRVLAFDGNVHVPR